MGFWIQIQVFTVYYEIPGAWHDLGKYEMSSFQKPFIQVYHEAYSFRIYCGPSVLLVFHPRPGESQRPGCHQHQQSLSKSAYKPPWGRPPDGRGHHRAPKTPPLHLRSTSAPGAWHRYPEIPSNAFTHYSEGSYNLQEACQPDTISV